MRPRLHGNKSAHIVQKRKVIVGELRSASRHPTVTHEAVKTPGKRNANGPGAAALLTQQLDIALRINSPSTCVEDFSRRT
ncbi:hypothetical protein EVAR_95974_1 [Eumeta japonica]|uniref:Uncharacterized protein n=1 Tax=Eumeta variegata TaxID=151549 RepID=A0A4C1V844_EUMVA|nr:hypothetical protein EVAR_95974_1 [Eumeta japonica]